MQFHVFKGSDVINIRRDQPLVGNPAFADIAFRPRTNLAARVVAGLGIYAIHVNDRLIYIGKFLGKKATRSEATSSIRAGPNTSGR